MVFREVCKSLRFSNFQGDLWFFAKNRSDIPAKKQLDHPIDMPNLYPKLLHPDTRKAGTVLPLYILVQCQT